MAASTSKVLVFIKLGVLVLVLFIYFLVPGVQEFVVTITAYLRNRNFDDLRQFILSYGNWAPLVSILLMSFQSTIPLVPGLFLTISNAWIFGWMYGALYSWTGALLGAALDFGIARWYGRPLVERIVNPRHLTMIDRFFQHNGVLAVFITRLTPVIPFKAVSYGSGLTSIPVWHFLLATGVGQTPAIILYSVLGQQITKNIHKMVAITTLMALAGLLLFFYWERIERFFHMKKK